MVVYCTIPTAFSSHVLQDEALFGTAFNLFSRIENQDILDFLQGHYTHCNGLPVAGNERSCPIRHTRDNNRRTEPDVSYGSSCFLPSLDFDLSRSNQRKGT